MKEISGISEGCLPPALSGIATNPGSAKKSAPITSTSPPFRLNQPLRRSVNEGATALVLDKKLLIATTVFYFSPRQRGEGIESEGGEE
jgi:hypothetical protein